MKTIGLAADHAGFTYKEEIKKRLMDQGYAMIDFGANSEANIDYPDVAHPLASAVESGQAEAGIALCGSGNGINMTLNKHRGIRSALCWTPEIASLARRHNDANICALPARFIDLNTAFEIVDVFLNTSFEGGRHQKRVEKIPC
jgi:ribose 5-phosphate isomerase B